MLLVVLHRFSLQIVLTCQFCSIFLWSVWVFCSYSISLLFSASAVVILFLFEYFFKMLYQFLLTLSCSMTLYYIVYILNSFLFVWLKVIIFLLQTVFINSVVYNDCLFNHFMKCLRSLYSDNLIFNIISEFFIELCSQSIVVSLSVSNYSLKSNCVHYCSFFLSEVKNLPLSCFYFVDFSEHQTYFLFKDVVIWENFICLILVL